MPDTPDRPDGSADHDDLVAEAGDDAARETVRVDLASHPTRAIDARPTVALNRETVLIPRQRDRKNRAPLPIAAGFATLWAALLSYLPVAVIIGLARTFEDAGGLGGAAGGGLAAWLLGHGVPLGTSIGPVSLAPLLLTLLAGWRLNRAGLHVTRAIGARRTGSLRAAFTVAGTVGLWYAFFGALAAMLITGETLTVSPMRAAAHFFVIGLVGALVGSLRGTDAVVLFARKLPPAVRHGLRTGVVAALLILAAGAACTGLSVAFGGGEAADMISAYRTGVAGQAGITLVSVAYGANAAVWAAAYLLGPGFALGAGTSVGLTEVVLGPLPTLPLLAGLPAGPMGATGVLLLAVPVLAGLFAGGLLTQRLRRDQPDPGWSLVLGSAAAAGPIAGLMLGLLAWMSAGSLGDGRLASIGPNPWLVGLVTTAVVAVAASLGAAAGRSFRTKK
jgi:Family of unknown function (DUF6350)